jgi:hypothetical protein
MKKKTPAPLPYLRIDEQDPIVIETLEQRSRLHDDRILAIEGLVTEVRACMLGNCETVMAGVSLTAALEAARLLARQITREVDGEPAIGHAKGETRVRWEYGGREAAR